MTSNRERAERALSDMVEAIRAEVTQAGEAGLRNDEVARALGLETSINGGQRNHLTHALLNRLVAEGSLKRVEDGHRIKYQIPFYVEECT